MADTPHRRHTDRRGGPPTVIGPGVSFRGDLIAPGSLVLAGTVVGDGDIGGTLSVARDARWEGNVRASNAVVAGTLIGTVECTGALEVGAAAVIRGQVTANSLAIASGAVIEGEMRVTSGQPVKRFEEKRASRLEP